MLAGDEGFGKCIGSTMAGFGKREDRHTVGESHYYLNGAREVFGTGEDFLADLFCVFTATLTRPLVRSLFCSPLRPGRMVRGGVKMQVEHLVLPAA